MHDCEFDIHQNKIIHKWKHVKHPYIFCNFLISSIRFIVQDYLQECCSRHYSSCFSFLLIIITLFILLLPKRHLHHVYIMNTKLLFVYHLAWFALPVRTDVPIDCRYGTYRIILTHRHMIGHTDKSVCIIRIGPLSNRYILLRQGGIL